MVFVGKQDRTAALLNEQCIRLQVQIGNGILWSNDDAYAQVMGHPELSGLVRGVGFGITPSRRSATSYSQFTLTLSSSRAHQRMLELETSHEELREQLAQSEARHQGHMTEMMTTMKGMFEQLSQGMRDIGHSQVENKCYLPKHYFL